MIAQTRAIQPVECAEAHDDAHLIGADLVEGALAYHAMLCGVTLARAHARSGDPARIAGYIGTGTAFDSAISAFALAYAAQNRADWRLFLEAIKAGQLEARGA